MKQTALKFFFAANLSLIGCVYAGSMGPNEATTWTGFYLGANGGGGWGNPSVSMSYLANGQIESNLAWYPTHVTQQFSGAIFGGQIGYNYQLQPQWVIGLKYDTDLSQWTAYTQIPSGDTSGSVATLYSNQKLNWFGHLLPRLGYLIKPDWLVYGTGGLTFGNMQGNATQSFNVTSIGTSYPGFFNVNHAGWGAGAGIEWKMSHLSFAAEYLYNDLGNNTVIANETFPSGATSSVLQNQYVFKNNFQTISLAVNYYF